MNSRALLTDIEAYLLKSGFSATHFGLLACGNARLVARLRDGGDVMTSTEDRVRAFMAANPDARPQRGKRRKP